MLTKLVGTDGQIQPLKGLSFLDRFLVLWILLAMAIGIILGNTVPSAGPALQKGQFVGVSIPIGQFEDCVSMVAEALDSSRNVPPTIQSQLLTICSAIGLLVMMYPILCKVRYETLHLLLATSSLWTQILISFVLNWIIAPLFMVALAWAFLPDRQDLREWGA